MNENTANSMNFFNKNIYITFQTNKEPIRLFFENTSGLEKQYKNLLEKLGCNYDKYSHAFPTSSDNSMQEFYNELELLIKAIESALYYNPSLDSSCTCLKNQVQKELEKKLRALPSDSPYSESLRTMEKSCVTLLKNVDSQRTLLKAVYSKLCAVKKILTNIGTEDEEDDMNDVALDLKDDLMNGLIQKYNKTPDEAFTFLSQKEVNSFIKKLCNTRQSWRKNKTCAAASHDMVEGFIEGIEQRMTSMPQNLCYT